MCYRRHMRLHITLEDELVAELDGRVGRGRRSAFIARLIRIALEDERRWERVERALGQLDDEPHVWDDDPAAWVRAQRAADRRRSG